MVVPRNPLIIHFWFGIFHDFPSSSSWGIPMGPMEAPWLLRVQPLPLAVTLKGPGRWAVACVKLPMEIQNMGVSINGGIYPKIDGL
jgi:hypothetical protein